MHQCKLASFDLDGTLIHGTSSAAHLAGKMGDQALIREQEASYAKGEISSVQFGDMDAWRYRGYSKHQIHRFLDDVPVIRDISLTVNYFKSRRIDCVISTMAWDFIGEYVALKHGFSAWSGPSLETDSAGRFTGRVEKYFHETEKISFIETLCADKEISMTQVVHIGDSRSDFPLFEAVGFSLALNGCGEARRRTHVSLDTGTLFAVTNVLPGLDQT